MSRINVTEEGFREVEEMRGWKREERTAVGRGKVARSQTRRPESLEECSREGTSSLGPGERGRNKKRLGAFDTTPGS